MRFVGSVAFDHDGNTALKVRNKTQVFVEVPKISLAILGDIRYFELFQDFAGQVWVRKPAGKQTLLPRPFRVITRFNGVFTYKDCP
jgi:hypothetical protein